jgi:hypothetical protein
MKICKRVILFIVLLSMLVVPLYAFASTYVANKRTGVFHYQGCKWEQKMWEENRAYYDNREDCINDGYRPCKVCRP